MLPGFGKRDEATSMTADEIKAMVQDVVDNAIVPVLKTYGELVTERRRKERHHEVLMFALEQILPVRPMTATREARAVADEMYPDPQKAQAHL